MIRSEKVDFICIQETKKESVDDFLCQSLWGGPDVQWVCKESIGNSGGMLCLWGNDCFVLQDSFVGNGYLGVKGIWGNTNSSCYIFNIYSPCSIFGKRELWSDLRALWSKNNRVVWCLARDFNTIICNDERKGTSLMWASSEGAEFNEFIEDLQLNDLPLVGRKFTWHRANGSCMSRIDRFLVSDEWLAVWQDLAQWGLERTVSDHCPLVLKGEGKNWGARPFRVMNCWFYQQDFQSFVEERWNRYTVHGLGSFVVKEKLKLLKNDLKAWNFSSFGNFDDNIQQATMDIKRLDDKGELSSLSAKDVALRRELFDSLWKLSKMKDSFVFQRSRVKWLQLGDANSSYFHSCINKRRRDNSIHGLHVRGVWVDDPGEVKEGICSHFENLFK